MVLGAVEHAKDPGALELAAQEAGIEQVINALPDKWAPFVPINYAYGEGMDVVNRLTDEYATEHNVQNPPLE